MHVCVPAMPSKDIERLEHVYYLHTGFPAQTNLMGNSLSGVCVCVCMSASALGEEEEEERGRGNT